MGEEAKGKGEKKEEGWKLLLPAFECHHRRGGGGGGGRINEPWEAARLKEKQKKKGKVKEGKNTDGEKRRTRGNLPPTFSF